MSILAVFQHFQDRADAREQTQLRLIELNNEVWTLLNGGVNAWIITSTTRDPKYLAEARTKITLMKRLSADDILTVTCDALLDVAEGRASAAVSKLKKITERDKSDQRGWMFLASLQSTPEEKHALYEKACSVGGLYSAEALVAMAEIDSEKLGKPEEAEDHFREARKLGPNPRVCSNYAAFLHKRDRWAEAEAMAEEAIVHDPYHAHAHQLLALYKWKRGLFLPAKFHAEKATELRPHWPLAVGMLAIILGDLDDEGAELKFLEAINLAPQNPTILQNYARWLLKKKRLAEAVERATAAIGYIPLKAGADYRAAIQVAIEASAGMRDFSKAHAFSEDLTTAFPEDAAAWFVRGQLELAMGDYAAAVSSLEKACEYDPDNEEARKKLERAREKLKG